MEDYREWLRLIIGLVGSFLLGIVVLIRWVWKVRDILEEVNTKMNDLRIEMNKGFAIGEASTVEQIALTRHNLKNDIHKDIVIPLEELERQTVQLGRDIAVLKDRATRDGRD